MASKPVVDIPGYYFDNDKNRYFKIPKGQNKFYKKQPVKRTCYDTTATCSKKIPEKQQNCNRNIIPILQRQSLSGNNSSLYRLKDVNLRNNIRQLENINDLRLETRPANKIKVDHNGSKALALVDNEYSSEIKLICKKNKALVAKRFFYFLDTKNIQFCFTHLRNVNYSGILIANSNPPAQIILCPSIFNEENNDISYLRKDIKHGTPFACASSSYHLNSYQLSHSDGKRAILINHIGSVFSKAQNSTSKSSHACGGRGYTIVKLRSDIKCQQFSPVEPYHFNGLRNGQVIGDDLRTKITNHFLQLNGEKYSSVKDMHCLKNGVEIIINYEGTSPKVKKWDLRFSSKCILEYVLQNTVSNLGNTETLQWHVNADDNILSLCNEKTVKIWCIKTSEQIAELNHIRNLKTLVYLSNWQMFQGHGGILCANANDNYFVSTATTNKLYS